MGWRERARPRAQFSAPSRKTRAHRNIPNVAGRGARHGGVRGRTPPHPRAGVLPRANFGVRDLQGRRIYFTSRMLICSPGTSAGRSVLGWGGGSDLNVHGIVPLNSMEYGLHAITINREVPTAPRILELIPQLKDFAGGTAHSVSPNCPQEQAGSSETKAAFRGRR